MATSLQEIREQLAVLQPLVLDLQDESHLHAGHPGAQGGGGHYRLKIVSPHFVGLRSVARHRLVYDALSALMQGAIHAIAITALTPDEADLTQSSHC